MALRDFHLILISAFDICFCLFGSGSSFEDYDDDVPVKKRKPGRPKKFDEKGITGQFLYMYGGLW